MRKDKNQILIINRATDHGIDQCGGELFEAHGFQFCITNSFDEGVYHAIELSTGISICSRFVCSYLTEKGCINSVKTWIKKHRDDFAPSLIEKGKALLTGNGLNYPLNASIAAKDTAEKNGAIKKEQYSKKWAALGGEPRKVIARLDPIQFKRAEAIRDKYNFKSIYAMSQYLWACFLRVADPDNDTEIEPLPEEIEMMFGSYADSEKHFEYVKPKRSINQASLNDNKHNLKSNQL